VGVETAILGSAVLGAGSSFLGAQDAKKQNKKNQKLAAAAIAQQRADSLPLLAEGEAYTRKQADALTSGFDESAAQIERTSALGQRDLGDARVRAGGETAQRLTDRGLGGTTIGEQATQGVGRAYARDMADFSSRMGQLRASLAQQRAQAKSRAYGQLAQFQAYKRNALADPLRQQAELAGNTVYGSNPVDLSGFGSLAALYGSQRGAGSVTTGDQLNFAQQGAGSNGYFGFLG